MESKKLEFSNLCQILEDLGGNPQVLKRLSLSRIKKRDISLGILDELYSDEVVGISRKVIEDAVESQLIPYFFVYAGPPSRENFSKDVEAFPDLMIEFIWWLVLPQSLKASVTKTNSSSAGKRASIPAVSRRLHRENLKLIKSVHKIKGLISSAPENTFPKGQVVSSNLLLHSANIYLAAHLAVKQEIKLLPSFAQSFLKILYASSGGPILSSKILNALFKDLETAGLRIEKTKKTTCKKMFTMNR